MPRPGKDEYGVTVDPTVPHEPPKQRDPTKEPAEPVPVDDPDPDADPDDVERKIDERRIQTPPD